jgi:hypothetical protein
MKINRAHAFAAGVVVALLAAAAKFVGGTPLDQTFTYQGQLRNAGQLVNGPVDLRITLWDADVAGGQVGSANTFNAMQLNDGRFACGLNFGNAAFDGSNRWIQVEFRNPAGTGQYQALTPRDKITATPYALYALNGANGVWVYNTNEQAVTVTGKKVGIGTSNPTAALEVVDAVGGDDSVKLPAGAVGKVELDSGLLGSATLLTANVGCDVPLVRYGFSVDEQSQLIVDGALSVEFGFGPGGYGASIAVKVDGAQILGFGANNSAGRIQRDNVGTCITLSAGEHVLEVLGGGSACGPVGFSGLARLNLLTVPSRLNLEQLP